MKRLAVLALGVAMVTGACMDNGGVRHATATTLGPHQVACGGGLTNMQIGSIIGYEGHLDAVEEATCAYRENLGGAEGTSRVFFKIDYEDPAQQDIAKLQAARRTAQRANGDLGDVQLGDAAFTLLAPKSVGVFFVVGNYLASVVASGDDSYNAAGLVPVVEIARLLVPKLERKS